MSLMPNPIYQYHVFLASPGDVSIERRAVRTFFENFNRQMSHVWNVRFDVVDWENHATIGVGRPQDLITRQTLEKYRPSLALVIGIMAQRFGSPSGKAESGTEEEFNWAMEMHQESGFPEIKWFFRKVDKLDGLSADPAQAKKALEQWEKVLAFRQRMRDFNNPVFHAEYADAATFASVLSRDLELWLTDAARPWAARKAAMDAANRGVGQYALPVHFDSEAYRSALNKRFDHLNFESLDTTGVHYSAVRLWRVFVPQSVRECHHYNPRLLEIPKEHQQRLLNAGDITAKELEDAELQANRLRQDYFNQPQRPVMDVVDGMFRDASLGLGRRLVILGDPGSGKSSLIRYLAIRWASITETAIRDAQSIPLVIELGHYARWQCEGRKDFIRYFEEGPVWHEWPSGLLSRLLEQPGRITLLLDGLDEVFDPRIRDSVINDIQRFSTQFAKVPVMLTSRVVGYQASRLRDVGFQHFMLQDLDPSQISDFLMRWHEVTFDDPSQAAPKRERLQKSIRESKSIGMLAGNPLLLTMMAILNRNQELPRDRADLYGQASRLLLHQWDTERVLSDFPGIGNDIGLREKTDILRRIAAQMQAGPSGLKGNLIDGATLTDLIENYLHHELRFSQARAVARAVVEQLRQRNFILCFVGADTYAFVHRTFLEYFCAADFVHQFNVAKTLDIDGLISLFEQHRRDDEWREVLRLICGQIDEPFVAQIVEHLASGIDLVLPKWDGMPLPELLLAIGCLSEARNIARLENAGAALIEVLLKVYIAEKGTYDFRDQLLAAQREIGTRWPGTESLSTTIFRRESEADSTMWASDYLVSFLACVRPVRQEIERLAASKNSGFRWGACKALAENWPDQNTRDLLSQRAVQDEDDYTRGSALWALAEKWPDQTTRGLLTQLAVNDASFLPRSWALEALAENWPDQTTRDLLTQRAVLDNNESTRVWVLHSLAKKWPDQITRDLLTQRALKATEASERGGAYFALAENHSEFGRILLTEDLDGNEPYLDPRKPISRQHVEAAATKAGILPKDIGAELASLTAFLGWDVLVGLNADAMTKKP